MTEISKNGIAIKIVVAALGTGLVFSTGGLIKLYRDVGVLQSDLQTSRRLDALELLAVSIASDRDKRTIILQNIHDEIVDLKRRMEKVEGRR
jgi:hypothetical protein